MAINTEAVLSWYTGKALEAVRDRALPALLASLEQGYWVKGASRSVPAMLGKSSVAAKIALAHERAEKAADLPWEQQIYRRVPAAYDVRHAMQFGSVLHAARIFSEHGLEIPEIKDAGRWVETFAPVADAIILLNSRRPKPVIVMDTLSPTVLQNLGGRLKMDLTTIRPAPVKGRWVEITREYKDGTFVTEQVWSVQIEWPEGTVHGVSRFSRGSAAGNHQCEACGHAILSPWNWVPLLTVLGDGRQASLWVGRDCAGKLFHCKVTGDAIYENPET